MQPIQLDLSRLFGFRIVAADIARQQGAIRLGAKIGQKEGQKSGSPLAAQIAGKVGAKVGNKNP